MKNHPELKRLIKDAISIFGEVVQIELGKDKFELIESLRQLSKQLDQANHSEWDKVTDFLSHCSQPLRLEISHAFTVMLEIINTCETSYRTYKLQQPANKTKKTIFSSKNSIERISLVTTAHPTEARTGESLQILKLLGDEFLSYLKSLDASQERLRQQTQALMQLALQTQMSKAKAPTVQDEAVYIMSILLSDQNIDTLLRLHRQNIPVFFRTWVGGDKDGHPGVSEIELKDSLQQSRTLILGHIERRLQSVTELIQLRDRAQFFKASRRDLLFLGAAIDFKKKLSSIRKIKPNDGLRLKEFKKDLKNLLQLQTLEHPLLAIKEIETLCSIFPGLVLPLELREENIALVNGLKNSKLPIVRMLKTLAKIAGPTDPRLYARALIISQCQSESDLEAGWQLIKQTFGRSCMPVVPLLESRQALIDGARFIDDFLSKRARFHKKHLAGHFEVMLGYSDSAKEMGSWPSRWLVSQSSLKLEQMILKHQLRPIFFHGSGGSVSRGGGPIENQMSWWPKSARSFFKATLQGEMIQRSFASPEIFASQMNKIETAASTMPKTSRLGTDDRELLDQFTHHVQAEYQNLTQDADFLSVASLTTPYNYLHHLKLGSRPSKRKSSLELSALRAIPWVLCWTQLRLLLPAWWGVGSAYFQLTFEEKKQLKNLVDVNPAWSSFLSLLGFTLHKVRMQPFELALLRSDLPDAEKTRWKKKVSQELQKTQKAYQQLAASNPDIQVKPWLAESIAWRSPLIHPLNLLQKIALEQEDPELLRETVTGIACGMMTTG